MVAARPPRPQNRFPVDARSAWWWSTSSAVSRHRFLQRPELNHAGHGGVKFPIYTREVFRGKAFLMSVLSTVGAQHWDHDDHMVGGGWWWLWGSLMMILVLAAIALVAWLIIRSVQSGGGGTRSAREILSERYARGEIDSDEYEERLSKLR
jgi:putative membrane protein